MGVTLGAGMLWSRQHERGHEPTSAAAPAFTSYGVDATPDATDAQLLTILGDNPYLRIHLTSKDVDCSLPDIAGPIPADQFADYVRDGSECLAGMWQGPMAANTFDWSRPAVIVYDPAKPPYTSCADLLENGRTTYCYEDNTFLWPTTAQYFSSITDPTPEQNRQMVLWGLSRAYANSTFSHSGLFPYYLTLDRNHAQDPAATQEYARRLHAQMNCLSASIAYALPEGMRPSGKVASGIPDDFLLDSADPEVPTRETQLRWTRTGSASAGDLSVCDTWTVPAEQVA